MRDLPNALRGLVKPKHLLLLSSLILLSGCHDLENKAKDIIGATVKDPLALELRNVHASDTVSTTICGEFNAKNSFGGYVGFKPFAIDTRGDDKLTELDENANANDRDQYYIVCGDEAQRLDARSDIQARKDAAGRAERAAATAAKAVLKSMNEGNRAFISSKFKLPHLPTTIEQMQCHMGGCDWEQIISINDIERRGREVLRAVHSRTAMTETPDGQDYPTVLDPHAQVTWKESASYVLCSLSRPTSIWWDTGTHSYLAASLHIVSPFGYEQSAVAEYLMACHGVKPSSNEAQHSAGLGYVDQTTAEPQKRIADPKQVFASAD